jgi:hypothetical protein
MPSKTLTAVEHLVEDARSSRPPTRGRNTNAAELFSAAAFRRFLFSRGERS